VVIKANVSIQFERQKYLTTAIHFAIKRIEVKRASTPPIHSGGNSPFFSSYDFAKALHAKSSGVAAIFDTNVPTFHLMSDCSGGARTEISVYHQVAWLRCDFQYSVDKSFWLRSVEQPVPWKELIDNGYPVFVIAKHPGMPALDKLWRWISASPDLRRRYEDATDWRRAQLADHTVALADEIADNSPAGKKLKLSIRKWRTEMERRPEKHSRVSHEIVH
jgi:hypothetical protein